MELYRIRCINYGSYLAECMTIFPIRVGAEDVMDPFSSLISHMEGHPMCVYAGKYLMAAQPRELHV